MSFVDSNFGNNQSYLYELLRRKREQEEGNNNPMQQPMQQQQAFGQQGPLGRMYNQQQDNFLGLAGLGKNIYDQAMARRHDGMYQGKPVIGSGATDKENAMMGRNWVGTGGNTYTEQDWQNDIQKWKQDFANNINKPFTDDMYQNIYLPPDVASRGNNMNFNGFNVDTNNIIGGI